MGFLAMKTNAVVFCFILRTFWIPWSFFEGCIHPDRKEVMNCEMPLGGSLPSVWQPPFICDVLMCVFVLMSFFLLPLLCSSSPTRWDMTLVDQIVYWTNVKKAEHHRSSSVWEEYTALFLGWHFYCQSELKDWSELKQSVWSSSPLWNHKIDSVGSCRNL